MGLGSFLGNLVTGGGISRAKEQNKANQAAFQARKTQFGQLQKRRGTRLGAVQQFLGALQGSLPSGAPNYQFDPATLAELQTPVDFAEAAPADVSKGAGYGALRSGIGMGISGLANAYMGGLFGGGNKTPFGGPDGAPMPGAPGMPIITGNEDLGPFGR